MHLVVPFKCFEVKRANVFEVFSIGVNSAKDEQKPTEDGSAMTSPAIYDISEYSWELPAMLKRIIYSDFAETFSHFEMSVIKFLSPEDDDIPSINISSVAKSIILREN